MHWRVRVLQFVNGESSTESPFTRKTHGKAFRIQHVYTSTAVQFLQHFAGTFPFIFVAWHDFKMSLWLIFSLYMGLFALILALWSQKPLNPKLWRDFCFIMSHIYYWSMIWLYTLQNYCLVFLLNRAVEHRKGESYSPSICFCWCTYWIFTAIYYCLNVFTTQRLEFKR